MTLEPFAAVQAAAVASSERLAPERCCCAPSLITQPLLQDLQEVSARSLRLGAAFLPQVGGHWAIFGEGRRPLQRNVAVLTPGNRTELVCHEEVVIATWTCTQHKAKQADKCRDA